MNDLGVPTPELGFVPMRAQVSFNTGTHKPGMQTATQTGVAGGGTLNTPLLHVTSRSNLSQVSATSTAQQASVVLPTMQAAII